MYELFLTCQCLLVTLQKSCFALGSQPSMYAFLTDGRRKRFIEIGIAGGKNTLVCQLVEQDVG